MGESAHFHAPRNVVDDGDDRSIPICPGGIGNESRNVRRKCVYAKAPLKDRRTPPCDCPSDSVWTPWMRARVHSWVLCFDGTGQTVL